VAQDFAPQINHCLISLIAFFCFDGPELNAKIDAVPSPSKASPPQFAGHKFLFQSTTFRSRCMVIGIPIRRREFIVLFCGACAWPLAARAQQPAMLVVGYLDAKASAASSDQVAAFRQGLKEAGFIEGHDVAIEFRWAENALDRLPALAIDLVQRRVAAIVASNIATPAAKAATSTVPIIFVSAFDPVESGLVSSLARRAAT
jgi:hypothetical protein